MNDTQYADQVVACFEHHSQAEQAVQQLAKAGQDMKNLSIVGRDYHTEEVAVGYVNTGDKMLAWGKFGAFWGSIWGILFGSAVLIVPGVGTVLVGGWIVAAVVAALEGAVIGGGLGAVGGALSSVGVPKDSIIAFESAIKAGKFLVIVRGTPTEVTQAQAILKGLGAEDMTVTHNQELVGMI